MKHTNFFIALIAICAVMVSCNKEGQFNPKKKISKISYSNSYKWEYYGDYGWETEESGSSSYVGQIWNWNGKQLESIDYYDEDGILSYTEHYTYKGKRLSTISWGGSGRYELLYDKGKLSSIEYYSGSTREAIYTITRDGAKITKIHYASLGSKAAEARPLPTWLFNLPVNDKRGLATLNNPKGSYSVDYIFEWEGDNVKHYSVVTSDGRVDYYYTYDDKLSPWCGLWEVDEIDYPSIMSKNNVVRQEVKYDGDIEVYNVSYTYQGKFPATATVDYNESYDDERYTSTSTTLFDYK